MAKRRKSSTLNLRIEDDLKAVAVQAAADERRSLTTLIEVVLVAYLRDKGYLPK
jgi:predicted HicB family RNase H-like nuclease